ncbi:hypothetical protein VOLCADRAFT_89191 [Volvox carteri f. nagariensis]|uniref:Inner centromere protein ARK-binding domain-containing protein n=1 Tax=Volvox carteri f. nagariensis TaxID=3068 RepID=D8TR16_VOLCA|nr:uncharacterized protein VOLCADRAFT_89191 [Volvox carteri f. nagariensis]EFJ50122.1 hypothetical protein VOLCADRAFT_89191 [Volvox carteri f. nagariensis]|eukprot:XP_002948742.1 hypothetical protein VOLCADRAFT_89191 [Volvox carteri f. nagariensis]
MRVIAINAREQEDRRCLEELTNATLHDADNLVAQARRRVYQLRNRQIVVKTPDGGRRKNVPRTLDTETQAGSAHPGGVRKEQKENDATGRFSHAPGSGPGQPQGVEHEHVSDEVLQRAEPAAAKPSPVHAGQKRGLQSAASQAKPKRPKAQAGASAPVEALDATGGSCHGPSPQPSEGRPATVGKPIDVGTLVTATPVQSQPIGETPVGQTLEKSADNGSRRGRARPKKQPTTQPAGDVQTDMAQPAEPAIARGQSAVVGYSPRVTRSRRAQPPAATSPSAAATKQVRSRSTRQKRDMKEAQLGSPGMHPKSKAATERGAIVPPAPLVTSEKVGTAVTTIQPSTSGGASEQHVGKLQATAAMEELNACSSGREVDAGQHLAGAHTDGPGEELCMHEQDDMPLPLAEGDGQPNGPVSEPTLDDVAGPAAAMSGQLNTGPKVCGRDGEEQQPASFQPNEHAPAPQRGLEKPSAAATANVKRMPANVAAALAVFGAISAKAGVNSSAKATLASPCATTRQDGRSSARRIDPPGPGLAPGTEAVRPAEELFSFGTKPKEQSSPTMPHFGSAAEQVAAAGNAASDSLLFEQERDGTQHSPVEAAVLVAPAEDMAAVACTPGAGPSSVADQTEEPEVLEEVQGAGDCENANDPDAIDGQAPTYGEDGAGIGAEANDRVEFRHRSLSLTLAVQSPITRASGAELNTQQALSDAIADNVGSGMMVEDNAVQEHVQEATQSTAVDCVGEVVEIVVDDAVKAGPLDPEQSLYDGPVPHGQESFVDVTAADEPEDTQTECVATVGAGKAEAMERDNLDGATGCDAGTGGSSAPAPSAQMDVQSTGAQADQEGHGADTEATVPPSKPKGSNLVSAIRSFLPQRTAPSPPPAAGKKPVKVKALEAAQAAKQKEAARQAERALARAAAADRQRQVQVDAGPSNAGGKSGDCIAIGAAVGTLEGVKAKAAFYQQREEQAKKAAAAQAAIRKLAVPTTAGAPLGAQPLAPGDKAGANARAAVAAGDSEAALVASAAAAPAAMAPPSAVKPSVVGLTGVRGVNPAPSAASAETVADKQRRVEAKRREEEERRRAELEARTKAKDDKLRNIEAAKQQQRLGGGGGAPRPPPPLIPNPVAVQASGRRPLLNGAGAGAGQAAAVYVKPEPENGNMGFVSLNAAKTPGPKTGTAKTPGPKTGPVANNMVSPAVQMQIKLLPAVHAQSAAAGPEGTKAAGAAPGLPRPKPVGVVQAKQAPVAAAGSQREGGVTPGAADLTEEDRRNVLAIQTSPYVMQVKPRTPAVMTATKPLFNYEISPYRSDSDSDTYDDEDGPGRRCKPVPAWAAEDKVLLAVDAQAGMNADAIFGSYPRTIDVVKVFSNMPPPGDKDPRGRPRRDYRRRGSSGNWELDMF